MSRYRTNRALKINATDNEKMNSSTTRGISHNIFILKGTWFKAINPVITTILIPRLIKAENDTARTTTYRGKASFLSNSTLPTIDVTPLFVTSTKKFQNKTPNNKYAA